MVHESYRKAVVADSETLRGTEARDPSDKELGCSGAIVNRRFWSIDGIGGNRFVPPEHVESRVGG